MVLLPLLLLLVVVALCFFFSCCVFYSYFSRMFPVLHPSRPGSFGLSLFSFGGFQLFSITSVISLCAGVVVVVLLFFSLLISLAFFFLFSVNFVPFFFELFRTFTPLSFVRFFLLCFFVFFFPNKINCMILVVGIVMLT